MAHARRPPWGARLCDRLLFQATSRYLDSTSDLRLDFATAEAEKLTENDDDALGSVARLAPRGGRMLVSLVSDSESSENEGDDEFHDADDGSRRY